MIREPARTAIRLADGRELLYFDERHGIDRSAADLRSIGPIAVHSELRHDPLVDEWVIVAGHRQDRTHLPPSDECPLCPSRPGYSTEIPAPDYQVVVLENRFPSLIDPGRCDVICFTDDHGAAFADLSHERVRLILDALADRTQTLSGLSGVAQVFPFENRGEAIGVTLHHPHGQIYAYPFVTPRTLRMLDVARAHREATGRDLFTDVLAAEERAETRIVAGRNHWTAFVPESARWPVEVHLYPHRSIPDLAALDDVERDELADLQRDMFGRVARLFGRPMPYIAAWHQAPVRVGRDLLRLHLRLFSMQRAPDRLKFLAGSESAMGVFINDLVPEETAQRLRDA